MLMSNDRFYIRSERKKTRVSPNSGISFVSIDVQATLTDKRNPVNQKNKI
jgi:hypothetical protein